MSGPRGCGEPGPAWPNGPGTGPTWDGLSPAFVARILPDKLLECADPSYAFKALMVGPDAQTRQRDGWVGVRTTQEMPCRLENGTLRRPGLN